MAQGKSQNVYFISLTSCSEGGIPTHPTALFDLFSKKQMLMHGVIGMTVHDLYNEYKKSNGIEGRSKDLFQTSANISQDQSLIKIFDEASKNFGSCKMTAPEFIKICGENGMNATNALAEAVRRAQNPTKNKNDKVDVYNLLYWYVKKKSETKQPFHIFIDEFPVLQSRSSKLWIP